uniref:Uncharacterized protein n=1 Tax=Strigamia maritima TaxID=126957 RepID=T1INF5_STRMM
MMDVFASILEGPDSTEDKKTSSEETKRASSSEETKKTSSSEDNPIVAKSDNRTNSFNVKQTQSDSVLPRIPIFPGSMFLSPSMASRLTSNMHKRKRMNGNKNRSPFPGMARNMGGIFPQQNSFPFMQRPIPPMLQLGAGRLMAQDFLHRPGMESFLPIIGNTMTRPGSPFGPTGTSGFDTSGIQNSNSFSSSFGSNPLINSQFRQGSSFGSGGISSSSDLSGGMSSLSSLGSGINGLGGGMSGLGGGFGGLGGGMSGLGSGMSGLGGGFGGLGGGMSGLGGGIGGLSGLGGGIGGLRSGLGGFGGGIGGFSGLGGGMSGLGGFGGGLGGGMSGLGGLGSGLGGLGGGLGGLGGFNGGFGGLGSGLNPTLSGMSGLGLQNPSLRFTGSGSGIDFSSGDSQTSNFGMGSTQDDFDLAQRPLGLAKNSSLSMFESGNSFGMNPLLGANKFAMGLNGMPMINPLLIQQAGLLGLNQRLLAQARPNPLLVQSLMAGGGNGLTPMIQPGGLLSLQPQKSFLDLTNGRNANSMDNLFRPNRTFDVLSGGVFSGSNRDVTKMTNELPEKARVIIEPISQLSSPAISEGSTTTLSSNH